MHGFFIMMLETEATLFVADEVSIFGDFFLMGGDSLRAGRCVAGIRQELGVPLKVTFFWKV